MKKITNKQYEEYQKLLDDKRHGRMLTPDGLRLICSACNYDPTEIGKIMLENLANLQAKGAVSLHPEKETDPEADNGEIKE
jgi:hypothetical protein